MDEVFCPEENAFPGRARPEGPVHLPEQRALRHRLGRARRGRGLLCTAARQYVLDRKQFGRPLAANQLVQKKLADMQTEITLGPAGLPAAGPHEGRRHRRGRDHLASSSATPAARRSTSPASRATCMGGNGISDEFGVMRHLVNLEVVNTYEGTHDVHALILGRAITGIAAFADTRGARWRSHAAECRSPKTRPRARRAGCACSTCRRVLAGPWAGQLLADLGADVIKVERPGVGDDTRAWGPPFAQGRRRRDTRCRPTSCAPTAASARSPIDIATPRRRRRWCAQLARAGRRADRELQGRRPGAVRPRLRGLRALNPRLIYCSITGFGQTGPYATRAGYDFMIQGMGG